MRQPNTKPEAIRQLEQELGFELTDNTNDSSNKKAGRYQPKTFECDEKGEVIRLNLNECHLEEIPNLVAFENLLVLDLSDNKIGCIEGLDSLKNLQELHLGSNQLSCIEGLDSLPNLKELDLRSNQLTRIDGLDSLSNLQSLDLSSNQLTRIEGLDTLSNLQNLNLRSNQLTRIEGLDSLSNLQSLDLSSNQLTRIEGLDSLSNLWNLNLSSNQLTRIDGLDSLSNLWNLNLSSNQLTRIEGLDTLSNLQNLDLSSNQLTRIEGLDSLPNLKWLYLGSNQLTRIEGLDSLSNLQSLDLSSNQLTRIEGLDSLPNLQELDLGSNQLTRIEGLDSLSNLQSLDLSSNQLTRIEGLDSLPNLQELDLGSNQLTRIEGLDSLPNLESLHLSSNQLSCIEGLNTLPNLQELSLSSNQLICIEGLDSLSNLRELYLNSNKLTRIEGLDSLPNLQRLNLGYNQLTRIEGLDSFPNLQRLDLGYNQLTRIEGLDSLKNLQELYLDSNQLTRIEGLDSLFNLQRLDLGSNQLSRIEGLDSLKNLQELDLSSNQLSRIEGLDSFPNLQRLDLGYNQLTRIEGLDSLKNLQELYLDSNQLTRIEGLDSLFNLQRLDLGSNQLSRIEGLDSLKNLQELDLSSNQLSRIEGLDSLSNLQKLYLSSNHLSRIEGLDSFPNLQELYLSSNQLTVIENLPQGNKLKTLLVGGNNIEYIRITLSDKNSELLPCRLIFSPYENHLEDILRWQKRKPLPEKLILPIKVMLLGNHASGKSTFLNFLRGEKKKPDSTHVLQVVKKEDLGANFYDFGGQDFYHGIYHAFYSTGALYMLFWRQALDKNCRGEELIEDKDTPKEKILNFDRKYWLGQIRYVNQQGRIAGQDTSNGENVLVVQTHADCDSQQNLKETEFTVREEFYVALDREKKGTEALQKLHQQQDKATKSYLHFRLQEEIAHLKEKMSIDVTESEKVLYDHIAQVEVRDVSNPIQVEDLRKELRKKGYKDSIASLKGELHQLYLHGEVLYYKDDEDLSNLVWLDPEATVNYIHTKILRKKSVGRGVVVKEKLRNAENKDLIRLLELEKVIYDNGKEYIIPGYLPLAEVDEMYEWLKLSYLQPNITLKFEHFIPFGLINQLICYYGRGENELKKFWRDQLFFTLVNTPSKEEHIKRGDKDFLLYGAESRLETYPEGRYMVWISLNHERLTIEVYIKPVDKGIEHRVDKVERMLLQDILDMYWSNIPPNNNKEYLSRRRQEHRRLRRDFPIEDLYISTSKLPLCNERRLFVKLSTIDLYDPKEGVAEAGISRGIAVAYPLQDKGELDKEKPQSISLRAFQHLTDNEYIGKMKKVFISYSKDDKAELRTCLQFFKPLENSGRVTLYYDERTDAGAEIHPTIRKEIEEADVIVVLVSSSLLATDYITRLELPLAKQLGKRIYPFILKPCMWEDNEIIREKYVALKGEQGASEKEQYDTESGTYVSEGMQLDVWKKFMEEFKKKIL